MSAQAKVRKRVSRITELSRLLEATWSDAILERMKGRGAQEATLSDIRAAEADAGYQAVLAKWREACAEAGLPA
ncbi:hypothetical protein UB45_07715 [Terrabacter sp. 28]|nr:hypothetical protein UB45_07715 [Terrabacter sp. 28]